MSRAVRPYAHILNRKLRLTMYKDLDLIAVKPVYNNPFISSVKVFDAVKVDNHGKESPVILYQRIFTDKTPKHVLNIEPSETPLKYNYTG